jgi:hypothetical protein
VTEKVFEDDARFGEPTFDDYSPSIPRYWQDILPSAFALIVYIQFSLIILFLVINSRAMGSTSTNYSDGHIRINSVKY